MYNWGKLVPNARRIKLIFNKKDVLNQDIIMTRKVVFDASMKELHV